MKIAIAVSEVRGLLRKLLLIAVSITSTILLLQFLHSGSKRAVLQLALATTAGPEAG